MTTPVFKEGDEFKWRVPEEGRASTQLIKITGAKAYPNKVVYRIRVTDPANDFEGFGAMVEEDVLAHLEPIPRLYTSEDCLTDSYKLDWNDRVLVMRPEVLVPEYRKPEYQLWRGDGGFGCRPDTIGSAVFAVCLADDERARCRRGDFLGVLKPELVPKDYNSARPVVEPQEPQESGESFTVRIHPDTVAAIKDIVQDSRPAVEPPRERDYKQGMRDEHY